MCNQSSKRVCTRRLVLKEFKFGRKFSPSQLVKYKDILGVNEYLIQENTVCDMERSLARAFLYTRLNSNSDILRLLIDGYDIADFKTKTGSNHEKSLILAIILKNLEVVKFLVEKGAGVDAKNEDSDTALIIASKFGKLEVLEYLVENDANVNTKDHCNCTALMVASQYGKLEDVKFLVEKGADVNAKNEGSDTALMLAS